MSQFRQIFILLVMFAFVLNCNSAEQIEMEKRVVVKKGSGHSLGAIITDTKDDSATMEGALLLDVLDDSEAEKIGLKEDDVFVEFEGEKIKNARQLHDMATEIEEEKEVKFKVNRDGKVMDFTATMKPMEDEQLINITVDDSDEVEMVIAGDYSMPHSGVTVPGIKKIQFHSGNEKGGFLGVVADDLTESLLEYFEVDHGVLVKDVVKESPAKKMGFKAGDVIFKIEAKDIKDYSDLIRTLNYYDPEDEVKIEYSRKGSKKSVKVKLGKKEGNQFGYKFHTKGMAPHGEHLIWVDETMGEKPMKMMKKLKKIHEDDHDFNVEIYII